MSLMLVFVFLNMFLLLIEEVILFYLLIVDNIFIVQFGKFVLVSCGLDKQNMKCFFRKLR